MNKILFYILILLNLLFLSCSSNEVDKNSYTAVDGVLDLREWDFEKNGIVELNGEWKFSWKPESFENFQPSISDSKNIIPIEVPGIWKENSIGYGIYYLTIIVNTEQYGIYGIDINGIGSVGEIYINGDLLTSTGIVGIDRKQSIPEMQHHITYMNINTSEVHFVVKVSNFHHFEGGIWAPLKLGFSKQMQKSREISVLHESYIIGIMFFMSIYLLLNFFLLGKMKPILYLGIFCSLLFIRFNFVGAEIVKIFLPHLRLEYLIKISYIDLYLLIPCFLMYITSLFPKDSFYYFNKVIYFISTIIILLTLFLPTEKSTVLLPLFLYITMVVIILLLITTLKAVLNRRNGSKAFFLGFIFIAIVATNDILTSRHIIYSIILLPVGMLLFIFSQAVMITKKSRELYLAKESEDLASQTKKDFLANISHEIRTPMNSIIGFIDLVLESNNIDNISKKYLINSSRSAKSLLTMINDILDVSKLESKKLKIIKSPFDLKYEVDYIIQFVKPLILGKSISLTFNITGEIPKCINTDLIRLRQILINLLGNAIKFTDEGQVILSLKCIDQNILEFKIIDSGIGIREEHIDIIFQSFNQADGSTARKYGGSGLGLTICKELSELLGGKLFAESVYGKGSEFTLLLPVERVICSEDCDNKCKQIEETKLEESKSEYMDKTKKYYRILIAEDIKENAELVTIRLEMDGHKVKVVSNGADAVDEFENGEYDLILMDIHMPIMDGLEASRIIRSREIEDLITIIALTASVMDEEIRICKEAGIDKVVSKPINFIELYSVMKDTIPDYIGNNDPYNTYSTTTPGINFDKGLDLWQNKTSYTNALIQFKNRYKGHIHDLTGLINDKLFDDAYIYCHALKGVSGNLSLTDIASISSTFCKLLKEAVCEDYDQLCETFETNMEITLKSINSLENSKNESI